MSTSTFAFPQAALLVRSQPTHRAPALRVVPWRTDGTKRRLMLAAANEVDALHDRACRMQRSLHRVRVERRIGIEIAQAGSWRRTLDRFDVGLRVNTRELLARRRCRFIAGNVSVEPERDHVVVDGCQTFRTLGMIRSHFVQKTRRMGDIRGGGQRIAFG